MDIIYLYTYIYIYITVYVRKLPCRFAISVMFDHLPARHPAVK